MRTMRVIIGMAVILLASAFTYAAPVNDSGSPNFIPWWSSVIYDYRDMGAWGISPLGKEGTSGAYFMVSTGIQTGGYLTDFNKVIGITATHSSGRSYPLTPAPCSDWQLPNHWPWSITFRPEGWMFDGTWSFTLVYTGSDKKEHAQICDNNAGYPIEAAPIGATPSAVSNAQIRKLDNQDYLVSWSGIGGNGWTLDYRIEIYAPGDVCVETVYRMTWRAAPDGTCPPAQVCVGTYDDALNRVSFIVDKSYIGRLIRLRQDIIAPNKGWPRALKQIRLPE